MGTRGLDGQPGWKPVAGLRPPGQNHRPGTQVSSAQWELGKAISLGAAQAAPCPHRVRGLRGASGLPWAAVGVRGKRSQGGWRRKDWKRNSVSGPKRMPERQRGPL